MHIKELRVNKIRSHASYSAFLDEHVTLVLGKNGTGKTTLLESLYYMLQGTSFRGRDKDMIAHNATRSQILLIDATGAERRASLETDQADKLKKVFLVEQRQSARLLAKHRQPVVLFEPDELRLLSSSPQRRRVFFDSILSRLSHSYASTLSRYQRVLMQRNELLKQQPITKPDAWDSHLFAWDIKFAELADYITTQRRDFVSKSNQNISQLYSNMTGSDHIISCHYDCDLPESNYPQHLIRLLEQRRHADALRGFTSLGPHRDDFRVFLDGKPVSETASRGEMRTIMLAYKLLEVALQKEIYQSNPIILMDDVFSELDSTREQHLMHSLEDYQTIITATDLRDELKINASVISL